MTTIIKINGTDIAIPRPLSDSELCIVFRMFSGALAVDKKWTDCSPYVTRHVIQRSVDFAIEVTAHEPVSREAWDVLAKSVEASKEVTP